MSSNKRFRGTPAYEALPNAGRVLDTDILSCHQGDMASGLEFKLVVACSPLTAASIGRIRSTCGDTDRAPLSTRCQRGSPKISSVCLRLTGSRTIDRLG